MMAKIKFQLYGNEGEAIAWNVLALLWAGLIGWSAWTFLRYVMP